MLHHHDPKVASALMAGVLPALRQAIKGAGESLAIEVADGEKVNIRHRTQAQQLLMFLLADYLTNSACDHSEDHLYEPLRPYELADLDYARQWFADLTDDGDTEPIYTVAERPAETVTDVTPEQPAQVRIAYQVNRDTALTEEGIGQAVLYPPFARQLDALSTELAEMYAPLEQEAALQNEAVYDLEAGKLAARRALIVSFLSWLQTDAGLDGDEIAILQL